MRNNRNTKTLIYNGLIIAIIAMMTLIPEIGYITVGTVAITIVHIPVLIACFLFSYKSGLIAGATFGISSWFVASTRGTATNVVFQNPLVSVLPRILFIFIAICCYQFLCKKLNNKTMVLGISSFIGTFSHTVLVLVSIYFALVADKSLFGLISFIVPFIALNFFIEVFAAVLIVTPAVKILSKVLK